MSGPLQHSDITIPCDCCLGGRFSSEFYPTSSLDGRWFVLDEFHKAYHHYIKVVGTMYEVPAHWGKSDLVTYQMLPEVGHVVARGGMKEEARLGD